MVFIPNNYQPALHIWPIAAVDAFFPVHSPTYSAQWLFWLITCLLCGVQQVNRYPPSLFYNMQKVNRFHPASFAICNKSTGSRDHLMRWFFLGYTDGNFFRKVNEQFFNKESCPHQKPRIRMTKLQGISVKCIILKLKGISVKCSILNGLTLV